MERLWRSLVFAVLAVLAFIAAPKTASAEPWMSTRFAGNCAACHAPGRKSPAETAELRCTRTCKGCHVNPQGGGLRSFYGKWTENRWLVSLRSESLRSDKALAPLPRQKYAKEPFTPAEEDEDAGDDDAVKAPLKGKVGKELLKKPKKLDAKADKVEHQPGLALVETDAAEMRESDFSDKGGEPAVAHSREEFLYQIPQQDPYRLVDLVKSDAGADIRWEMESSKVKGGRSTKANYLMDADFGADLRPLYRNLHLVYEGRMLGNPNPGTKYEETLGTARTRSLYIMVDDLPFNSYAMIGYYRPLIGYATSDHETLAQQMTAYGLTGNAEAYDTLFEAGSVGVASGMIHANMHFIVKNLTNRDTADDTQGAALNLGINLKPLGTSFDYTYWRTTDARATTKTSVEMHAVTAAVQLGPTTVTLEGDSITRDDDSLDYRLGGVYTLDTQTRTWRENYVTFMAAKANTTTDLLPGNAEQAKAGLRSFWVAGLETWVLLEYKIEKTLQTATSVTTEDVQGQIHIYF